MPSLDIYQISWLFELWCGRKHCLNHFLIYNQTRCTVIIPLTARFMGPTWGPSGADRTQVGPMLTPCTLLSGTLIGDVGDLWYVQIYQQQCTSDSRFDFYEWERKMSKGNYYCNLRYVLIKIFSRCQVSGITYRQQVKWYCYFHTQLWHFAHPQIEFSMRGSGQSG